MGPGQLSCFLVVGTDTGNTLPSLAALAPAIPKDPRASTCAADLQSKAVAPMRGSPALPLEGQGTPWGIEGPPPDTLLSLLPDSGLLQEAGVCPASWEIPGVSSGADGEALAGSGMPRLTLLLFSAPASLPLISASRTRLPPRRNA